MVRDTQTSKKCAKCAQIKDLAEFHGKKKKHSWCRQCFCTYKKTRYDTATDEAKAQSLATGRRVYARDPAVSARRRKAWLLKNPQKRRHYHLKRLIGDDVHLVNELPDVCAICAATENICIDHDHTTQRLRGKLCAACNKGLGFFRDNTLLLKTAAAYLRSPPVRNGVIRARKH